MNEWKAKGAPVNEHEEENLEKETDHSTIINDSNAGNTTLENTIRFSVSTTQSSAANKKLKERPQLPFSVAAFDESMESTADTTPLDTIPHNSNESRNGTKILDRHNQADIQKILQKNAPSGKKYSLTLVPKETDTLEKVLKSRNASAKKVDHATGAENLNQQGVRFLYTAVITIERYKKKISEIQKKLATGAKKKRKKRNKPTKPQKNQKK